MMTNSLISRSKAGFQSLRSWIVSKGTLGIAITASLTAVAVFVGVGGTMAATGVFPTLQAAPTAGATPTPTATASGSAVPAQAQTGDLPADTPASGHLNGDGLAKLQQSGWVGARFSFTPGGFQLIYAGIISDSIGSNITTRVSFNGGPGGGSTSCGPGRIGQTCPGSTSGTLTYSPYSPSFCLPGGDTYSVTVIGAGINFSESGIIPAGIINCSAAQQSNNSQSSNPVPAAPSAPPAANTSPNYVPPAPPANPSWPSPSAAIPSPAIGP